MFLLVYDISGLNMRPRKYNCFLIESRTRRSLDQYEVQYGFILIGRQSVGVRMVGVALPDPQLADVHEVDRNVGQQEPRDRPNSRHVLRAS